ncbi:MAG: hypothetical protein WCE48_11325 [Steroidobacteraceae bacterium]
MSAGGLLWFVLGLLTGVGAMFVTLPHLRGTDLGATPRRRALLGATVAAILVAGAAVALYSRTGSPQLATLSGAAVPVPVAHASAGANAGPADPMDAAIARLEQKLAQGGGSDADWALLAQSYDFVGRTDAVQLARAHKLPAGAPQSTPTAAGGSTSNVAERAASEAARYQAAVQRNPRDAQAWLALAESQRHARNLPEAAAAYAKAAQLNAMTADSWADYADVLAAVAGGSLVGAPADAIRSALRLDPRQTKGLWLDASLALEQRDYRGALSKWKKLRAVLPAESPDQRIVDANIAEAQQLASGAITRTEPAPSMGAASAAGAAAEVTGTVELAPALRSKVARGMTLFIYAKAPDAPGPPLAVLRTVVDTWPVRFRLDDGMAMMPTRRLSDFQTVIVEARVSRSGNALPAAGDLVATSPAIRPRDGRPVTLTISRELT